MVADELPPTPEPNQISIILIILRPVLNHDKILF